MASSDRLQPNYNVVLTKSVVSRAICPDLRKCRSARERAHPGEIGLAASVRRVKNTLAEQEQGVGGDRGIVGDHAFGDHFLEPGPWHPFLAHVLLFELSVRRARLEPGRQEEMSALAAGAVRAVQEPKLDQVLRPQPGFLQQFQPGEFFWLARLPVREAALRERPGAPADRIAELLNQ